MNSGSIYYTLFMLYGIYLGRGGQKMKRKLSFMFLHKENWSSIIGVLTRLLAGWSGVQILAGARDVSLLQDVRTGSEAHKAPYSAGYRASFLEAVQPEPEINHSPTSGAKVKNEWSYTSTPMFLWHVEENSFI